MHNILLYFRFLVQGVLLAMRTEFLVLDLLLHHFVLACRVVLILADLAAKCNNDGILFLSHR